MRPTAWQQWGGLLVLGLLAIPGFGLVDPEGLQPPVPHPPFLSTAETQVQAIAAVVSSSTAPSVVETTVAVVLRTSLSGAGALDDASAAPPISERASIVVQAGQTMWAIAQQHRITVEALQAANDLPHSALLAIGQKLVIPGSVSSPPFPPTLTPAPAIPDAPPLFPEHMISRVVEDGETLWDIAQAYSTSVDVIVEANSLPNGNLIFPGDRLVIPIHREGTGSGKGSARPLRPSVSLASVFVWPARGRVTSGFGFRRHPVFGTHEMHTGIDIGAPLGTPVVSARAGRVVAANWEGGYGKMVRVDHGDGLQTSYSHLSQIAVHLGQILAPGDLIGYVGNTGFSTGPHLLFEIRVNGRPLDPLKYL